MSTAEKRTREKRADYSGGAKAVNAGAAFASRFKLTAIEVTESVEKA